MPTMQIWSHRSTPISSSWFKLSGMWLYMAEISNQRHPNWSYQGPYLVPRTADYLPPLWSSADRWPYASGVCNVTGELWRLLHSWLTGHSLRDSSRPYPRSPHFPCGENADGSPSKISMILLMDAKTWMTSLIIMFAVRAICVQDSIFKMSSESPAGVFGQERGEISAFLYG